MVKIELLKVTRVFYPFGYIIWVSPLFMNGALLFLILLLFDFEGWQKLVKS